ncbi:MAG TPA: hypothetical protein VFU94_14085 [Conexibacter sp.]|nr:hypothetical protein [Conexibacter sp.]
MTAPLTPALALAYLRELSLDVRAAVVLDPAGAPIAGDPALAPRVRDLLGAVVAEGAASAADLLLARTPDGGTIAVIAGDLAIRPLLEHDLRTTAAALATVAGDLPGT